jgi:hypothetical protein
MSGSRVNARTRGPGDRRGGQAGWISEFERVYVYGGARIRGWKVSDPRSTDSHGDTSRARRQVDEAAFLPRA